MFVGWLMTRNQQSDKIRKDMMMYWREKVKTVILLLKLVLASFDSLACGAQR